MNNIKVQAGSKNCLYENFLSSPIEIDFIVKNRGLCDVKITAFNLNNTPYEFSINLRPGESGGFVVELQAVQESVDCPNSKTPIRGYIAYSSEQTGKGDCEFEWDLKIINRYSKNYCE